MKQLQFYLFCLSILLPLVSKTQSELYLSIDEALKNPSEARYIYSKGDSSSLLLLKTGAPKLLNIAGVVIDGKVENEIDLWDAFSNFRIIEQIILKDNELNTLSIQATSTMKEIWISGSPAISYGKLNSTLEKCAYLKVLRLHDFQFNEVPQAIERLSLLKKLEVTRSNWDFNAIIEKVKGLEALEQLILPDNRFGTLDKSIKYLPEVKHLDLSGNNLVSLSNKLKKVTQIDTLVINRNAFDELKTLYPLLKQVKIEVLVVHNDTLNTSEEIEYALPGKEVICLNSAYNSTEFILPKGTTKLIKAFKTEELKQSDLAKKEIITTNIELYSPAFIRYDQLQFPQPLESIDTLCFNSRYADSSYVYTEKITYQNETKNGYFYPLKYDDSHNTYYKKKRKKKIAHEKQSHIHFFVSKPIEGFENKVLVTFLSAPLAGVKLVERSDLEAFKDVTWEIKGYANNKEFQEDIMNQKSWSDIRIEKEADEETCTLILKSRFNEIQLNALPRSTKKFNDEKFNLKEFPKLYRTYQKELSKSGARFDKTIKKTIQQSEKKFIKEIDEKWEEVTKYMSEEEKQLTRYEWMPYYLKIKGKEMGMIGQEKIDILYLSRFLESEGFTNSKGNDFYIGQKWITFSLKSLSNEQLAIKDYCLIDLDRKLVNYFPASNSTEFLYDGYHNMVMIAQLKNGGFIFLDAKQFKQICTKNDLVVPTNAYLSDDKTNDKVAEIISNQVKEISY